MSVLVVPIGGMSSGAALEAINEALTLGRVVAAAAGAEPVRVVGLEEERSPDPESPTEGVLTALPAAEPLGGAFEDLLSRRSRDGRGGVIVVLPVVRIQTEADAADAVTCVDRVRGIVDAVLTRATTQRGSDVVVGGTLVRWMPWIFDEANSTDAVRRLAEPPPQTEESRMPPIVHRPRTRLLARADFDDWGATRLLVEVLAIRALSASHDDFDGAFLRAETSAGDWLEVDSSLFEHARADALIQGTLNAIKDACNIGSWDGSADSSTDPGLPEHAAATRSEIVVGSVVRAIEAAEFDAPPDVVPPSDLAPPEREMAAPWFPSRVSQAVDARASGLRKFALTLDQRNLAHRFAAVEATVTGAKQHSREAVEAALSLGPGADRVSGSDIGAAIQESRAVLIGVAESIRRLRSRFRPEATERVGTFVDAFSSARGDFIESEARLLRTAGGVPSVGATVMATSLVSLAIFVAVWTMPWWAVVLDWSPAGRVARSVAAATGAGLAVAFAGRKRRAAWRHGWEALAKAIAGAESAARRSMVEAVNRRIAFAKAGAARELRMATLAAARRLTTDVRGVLTLTSERDGDRARAVRARVLRYRRTTAEWNGLFTAGRASDAADRALLPRGHAAEFLALLRRATQLDLPTKRQDPGPWVTVAEYDEVIDGALVASLRETRSDDPSATPDAQMALESARRFVDESALGSEARSDRLTVLTGEWVSEWFRGTINLEHDRLGTYRASTAAVSQAAPAQCVAFLRVRRRGAPQSRSGLEAQP